MLHILISHSIELYFITYYSLGPIVDPTAADIFQDRLHALKPSHPKFPSVASCSNDYRQHTEIRPKYIHRPLGSAPGVSTDPYKRLNGGALEECDWAGSNFTRL